MARKFAESFGPEFGAAYNVGTLVLHVRPGASTYEDGDIISAIPRKRVRLAFAQHICRARAAARQSNGLIAVDHISRRYLEAVHEYKFQRVSPTTVMRTNLWTAEVDVVGPTPNERGEVIDVSAFLARRRTSQGFGLFGAEGAEVWYGGMVRQDHTAANTVWSLIEQHTPEREENYPAWPFTPTELQHFLAIHTDDFSDEVSAELVAPEIDDVTDPEAPVIVRKRKHQIPWRELRGMSSGRINEVLDPSTLVDVRLERKHVRASHVRLKAQG